MKPLTVGQALAMWTLVLGKSIGQLANRGRYSSGTDEARERPWSLKVHSRSARVLVQMGYARERCVMNDGRELRGADLVRFLGSWTLQYEITARGARAWQNATARERYGITESSPLKSAAR